MKRYCSICGAIELDEEKAPWTRYKDNPKYDYSVPTIDRKSGGQAKFIRDFDQEDDLIASGRLDGDLELSKHLTITKGRGKMQNINSLNTDARDNPMCMRFHKNPDYICYNCFSITGLEAGNRGSGASKKINSKLLTKRVYEPEEFPSRNITPTFRISSDGDIINSTHMMNIANFLKRQFDEGKIQQVAWWSKLPKYIREFIPYGKKLGLPMNKISLIFSTYELNNMKPKVPAGFDRCFTVYSADFIDQLVAEGKIKGEKQFVNCGARDCLKCMRCYKKSGEKIIREKVK